MSELKAPDNVLRLVQPPRPRWMWWPFGKEFGLALALPTSSRWHRILTRALLRSVWEKLP